MHWEHAETALRHLALYRPDLNGPNPKRPADVLATHYADAEILTNSDAATALAVGMASMGIDIRGNGPGRRLVQRAMAYLRQPLTMELPARKTVRLPPALAAASCAVWLALKLSLALPNVFFLLSVVA